MQRRTQQMAFSISLNHQSRGFGIDFPALSLNLNLFDYFLLPLAMIHMRHWRPSTLVLIVVVINIQFNSILFSFRHDTITVRKPMLYTIIGHYANHRKGRYLTRQLRKRAIVRVRASERLWITYLYVC